LEQVPPVLKVIWVGVDLEFEPENPGLAIHVRLIRLDFESQAVHLGADVINWEEGTLVIERRSTL